MANGSVVTTGLHELRAEVERLPDAVVQAARRVARDTAQKVATNARRRVPVRTGDLKGTIVVTEESAGRAYRISVGRMDGPPIAMFLEYGTERMDAKPFFGPSLEDERAAYMRDLDAATATAARS